MGLDRLSYKRDALLIEASRILTPQFNPITLSLTGAQVELLRNATAVFHKESTFVSTYHDTYYYTAATDDFDTILSLVADLEDKLMGNENTAWGYNDRYFEQWSNDDHAGGTQILETLPVSSGYIHVIKHVTLLQTTTSGQPSVLQIRTNGSVIYVGYWADVQAGIPSILPLDAVLKGDDNLRATWYNTAVDEYLELTVRGYKMAIPV